MEIVSYEQAKEHALSRYFTGVECKKGHISERRTSNKKCIACANAWQKSAIDNNSDYRKRQRAMIKKRMQVRYRDEEFLINRREKAKKHYYKNLEKMREKSRLLMRKRHLSIESKLSENIRYYIWRFVSKQKGNGRSKRIMTVLGYDIPQLKQHLEWQFTDGMNWENYGREGWHIDHITPKSTFNLKDEDEFVACWRLSNLRPMWGIDNKKKSNKIHFLL